MFFESIAAYQFDFTVKDWTDEKASQTIEKLVNSLDTIDGDKQEVVDEIRNCIVVDKHTNKDWSLDGVELSQTANNLANKLDTLEKVPKGIKIPNTAINNGHWIKTDLTYDSTTFELVVTDFEANDYIRYIIDDDDEKDEVMEERNLQSALKTLSQSKVTKNWKPQFKKRISSKVSPFTSSILETITKARTEHYTLTKKGPTSGPGLELVWNKQTGTPTSGDISPRLWTRKESTTHNIDLDSTDDGSINSFVTTAKDVTEYGKGRQTSLLTASGIAKSSSSTTKVIGGVRLTLPNAMERAPSSLDDENNQHTNNYTQSSLRPRTPIFRHLPWQRNETETKPTGKRRKLT